MSLFISNWFMVGLDLLMITYTLWVHSLSNNKKFHYGIGGGLLAWLTFLHLGLSTKSIFPEDISGLLFLILIFAAVGIVGLLLFFVPMVKKVVLGLSQQQLLDYATFGMDFLVWQVDSLSFHTIYR